MLGKVSSWAKKHLKQTKLKYLYIIVEFVEKFHEAPSSINPFCASFFVFIIEKSFHWFALQINELVSIW